MKNLIIKSLLICSTLCLTTAFGAVTNGLSANNNESLDFLSSMDPDAPVGLRISCKKDIEADYNTKGITINYGIVSFPQNQKPFTVDNNIYVPLNFFSEALGYNVENYGDDYINIGGGDVGRYSTQSYLLKDAMEYVGIDTPKKAVEVWSEGLKQRSGAIQYSVMTKELKEIYEKDLEKGYANWVTGVSSPWVDGYKIINMKKADDETYIFKLKYDTATSVGAFESFTVTLEVTKTKDFWRISKVNGDNFSTTYTGFVNSN